MRAFLRLLIGFLALSFVAGSTSAALACVDMPAPASASMPIDCPDQPVKTSKHESSVGCVQMCAALTPALAAVSPPLPPTSADIAPASPPLLPWSSRPEPPPPRVG